MNGRGADGAAVVVRLPLALRAVTAGAVEVAVPARSVGEALAAVARRHPALRRHLWGDDGRLRSYVNVFVNEEDARSAGGESAPVSPGDVVTIVPSIAGGAQGATGPEGFAPEERARYARHLILPEVGLEGQQRLRRARVAVVGAGGLGSPAALYLAAAGVGTLGLIDDDDVDLTNLQRQILYGTGDVGEPKAATAAGRLREMNPHVRVVAHAVRLTSRNALEVLADYDVVLDGTDNFPTRYLLNDACVLLGRPYVYGSIFRFEGQVSVFAAEDAGCYRCLFREPPPPGLVPGCAEAGVLGVLPGIVGSLQALEAIKLILGIGATLAGRLLLFDALALEWRELKLRRNPGCPACGDAPTITELIDYEAFCGMPARESSEAGAGAGTGAGGEVEPEIGARELKRRLERGDAPRLVDIREPMEWQIGNLGEYGAELVPLGELGDWASGLDPAEEVVLYCRSGARSERALDALRRAGYPRVRHLRGGLLAWSEEVDPEMPRY
jgi:sulfur-carrier protein adenylyltransferase/sulfurtransferase